MFMDFRERARVGKRGRMGGRERERQQREKETEREMCEKYQLVASPMCPNWDLYSQPFGVWDIDPTN